MQWTEQSIFSQLPLPFFSHSFSFALFPSFFFSLSFPISFLPSFISDIFHQHVDISHKCPHKAAFVPHKIRLLVNVALHVLKY